MPLILLPFYIVLCAIGAYGYKLSKSKYEQQKIKGKFFCICSSIAIMLIALLSPFFLDDSEPDNDDAYSRSQWYTLGTHLKKVKNGGSVLFITNPMSGPEKKKFEETRAADLLEGLGSEFSFGKIISPPSMKPPTADAPPIEQFTGEELEQLLADNEGHAVVIFTCQLPWPNDDVFNSRLCNGAEFHGEKEWEKITDESGETFNANDLPAIALVNPSALTGLAQALISQKRIDVVVRWKPGHSVDDEPKSLPETPEEISSIRYIMITPSNLDKMKSSYGNAKPRLFIK